jgi:hypothetical protein
MSDSNNFLKDNISKLIELEKEEEKYKNIFSNIKKEKEALNTNVIQFMQKNNITDKDIIFGDKKIKFATSKVQDGITKKLIYDRLKIYLKDDVEANNATNFIYSDRNISEKNYLKISETKK